MALMKKVRDAVLEGSIQPIFNRLDLQNAGINDPNNNLPNYDKKNKGSLNVKVLVSREINDEIYYTFDEKLFD